MAGRSSADKKRAAERKAKRKRKASQVAPTTGELETQHNRLLAEHTALVALGGASIAEKQARALAEELVWTSLAMLLMQRTDYIAAAKASGAGNKCAELALQLAKATLADRVHELEQAQKMALTKGAKIRGAASARKSR